jgi:hypothetical protein
MALATRPKPKVQHKKRSALHHRQSKLYMKTYWPYLPMLGIIGAGYLANQHWPSGLDTASFDIPASRTRIETLTGTQNEWALSLIVLIAMAAFGVFLFQHWFRVHRMISRGEAFVVKHPWFDISLVAVFTVGILLTRQ